MVDVTLARTVIILKMVHQRLRGQFVSAVTSWLQGRYSIIEGEAIAMMEAMKEVVQRGF
ncbi:hypothetical protein L195_g009677, partial [Trifolium pratense]